MEGSIGIFDSGIGGLTVAKAIKEACPNESIIYFGDTAHFPYGDKEKYSIRHYSDVIANFLVNQKCKAIVIACNTASAASATILQKKLGKVVKLFDVISPVAKHVALNYDGKKVGVIATKGTINSRVYPKSIKQLNENVTVSSLATPLLAPMIEEGFFNNTISHTIIKEYLSKNNLQDIESLVLACTHYPIIQKEIEAYYKSAKKSVEIINSADLIAKSIAEHLKANNLLNTEASKEEDQFFVSDFTQSFEKTTTIFFGKQVKLQKLDLWKV